ncbi:3'-5' exoribonuclease YhaM [Salinibacillus xinjiangensis]|uniref:3'-5' exoribonuclease YhaM n=1 Tax=Salinibacillus xinjiangensis TaxID=1229268 RepID=A0A6G1X7N4_9BACI|nr:3'-5' exoribonuclease YhaM [Salinibacillus xinjiangensis]MRG86915.1 3'-5' exoribonuclease YhaM [Salinibacillus xinjiangensis]
MLKEIGFVEVGQPFEGFLLIKSASKGVASNGKPFLTLILQDSSGDIEAKLWEATAEDEQTFTQETIIKVTGEITQFRGKPQLKIQKLRPTQPTDGVKLEDFLEKAPVEINELEERLTQVIFEMENPNIQRIVRYFIKKYEKELFLFPAAVKNHHEYVSGLAHHVCTMLNIAKDLKRQYDDINLDLLYAGIILHDLGKLKELSGPVTPSYTLEGKLLGHISIMAEELAQAAQELNIDGEEVLLLKHMILSHHGKGEWGSPKAPILREAELLHLIDFIDARMNMMNRSLEKTKPGEFTDRIFAMDNRSFYKPTFEK